MAAPLAEGMGQDLKALVALSLRQAEVARLARRADGHNPVKGRIKGSQAS